MPYGCSMQILTVSREAPPQAGMKKLVDHRDFGRFSHVLSAQVARCCAFHSIDDGSEKAGARALQRSRKCHTGMGRLVPMDVDRQP